MDLHWMKPRSAWPGIAVWAGYSPLSQSSGVDGTLLGGWGLNGKDVPWRMRSGNLGHGTEVSHTQETLDES